MGHLGGTKQCSSGQGPVATPHWQPWRAVRAGRTRPPSSSSCMRKAGATAQRASPWPKSACTGLSELHTCHCKKALASAASGPWPAEGRWVPKRQFPFLQTLAFCKIKFSLTGKSLRYASHAQEVLPHLEVLPFHSAGPGPALLPPGTFSVLPWACRLNKRELRDLRRLCFLSVERVGEAHGGQDACFQGKGLGAHRP